MWNLFSWLFTKKQGQLQGVKRRNAITNIEEHISRDPYLKRKLQIYKRLNLLEQELVRLSQIPKNEIKSTKITKVRTLRSKIREENPFTTMVYDHAKRFERQRSLSPPGDHSCFNNQTDFRNTNEFKKVLDSI